jgi:hypothetical protein
VYNLKLAEKIYEVMRLTPWCNHWLPTRMHKFDLFKIILDKMNELPNVVVRFSSDSIQGEYIKDLHGSVIFPEGFKDPYVYQCPSTLKHSKCDGCRECWNKDQKVIGYLQHGRQMKKVYKNLLK